MCICSMYQRDSRHLSLHPKTPPSLTSYKFWIVLFDTLISVQCRMALLEIRRGGAGSEVMFSGRWGGKIILQKHFGLI